MRYARGPVSRRGKPLRSRPLLDGEIAGEARRVAVGAAPGGDAALGDAPELADGAGVGEAGGGGGGLRLGDCTLAWTGGEAGALGCLYQGCPFLPMRPNPAPVQ